jgi:hypothetical protein
MKNTITVLFVIAMLISSTQTFRHAYVKWIEPQGSVLDAFQEATEAEMEKAKTLDQLVALYREAYTKVKDYEANPDNPKVGLKERSTTEPYRSEGKIKKEIRSREQDRMQLFKLSFYWGCGLLSLAIGIGTFYKVNAWLGVSGVIIGFSEMLCWTSPLFHNSVVSQQFLTLLNYKLIFSFITWVLLIALWLVKEKGTGKVSHL